MNRPAILAVAFFASASLVSAAGPVIEIAEKSCLPVEDNGVIHATVAPEIGGTLTRMYFRWEGQGDFYFVDLVAAGEGRYWGTPAKPEERNESVELFVAIETPGGETLSRSETLTVPVTDDCPVELSDEEAGYADNLTVGETALAQAGNPVLGFLCDGIVTRIDSEGVLRPDEVCRACVIAWWLKPEYLTPAAAAAAGLVCCVEPPSEVSSPRPNGR